MKEELKKLLKLAEEKGQQEERVRIAKEFFEYPNRERIPLAFQKDIAKIITIDIKFE